MGTLCVDDALLQALVRLPGQHVTTLATRTAQWEVGRWDALQTEQFQIQSCQKVGQGYVPPSDKTDNQWQFLTGHGTSCRPALHIQLWAPPSPPSVARQLLHVLCW